MPSVLCSVNSVRYFGVMVDDHVHADEQHRQDAHGHDPVQRALQRREAGEAGHRLAPVAVRG